jgi:hypothetical protein
VTQTAALAPGDDEVEMRAKRSGVFVGASTGYFTADPEHAPRRPAGVGENPPRDTVAAVAKRAPRIECLTAERASARGPTRLSPARSTIVPRS